MNCTLYIRRTEDDPCVYDDLCVYIRMADTLVLEAKPKPKPPQHPPVPQQPHPQHDSPGNENVVEGPQKPRSRLVEGRQRTMTQEPMRRGDGKTKKGRGAPSARARIHAPARHTARVATTNARRSKDPRSREVGIEEVSSRGFETYMYPT